MIPRIGLYIIVSLCVAASFIFACAEEDDENSGGGNNDSDSCADDEVWDPELGECVPEECGAERYPQQVSPEKTPIYVYASFDGNSDGSAENPYKTIGEALALAQPESEILIAAGTYQEALSLNQSSEIDITGRCAALAKVVNSDKGPALQIKNAESVSVRKLYFTSEAVDDEENYLIHIVDGQNFRFERNIIFGPPYYGFYAHDSSNVTLASNTFQQNTAGGVYFENVSEGMISENVVREIQPDNNGAFGRGIAVEDSEDVTVVDNTVEDCEEIGLAYCDSTGDFSQNTIVGNRLAGVWLLRWKGTASENTASHTTSDDSVGDTGFGISLDSVEDAVIAGNTVEANTRVGILVYRSTVDVTENTVRDTIANASSGQGYGIEVLESNDVTLSGNIVEANATVGISFLESSGTITDNQVRDTVPDEDGNFGWGMEVVSSTASVTVSWNTLEQNTGLGMIFSESTGTISNNTIRDTQIDATGKLGWGAYIQLGTGIVNFMDNTVEDNIHVGVYYYQTDGIISGNTIRNTSVEKDDDDVADGIIAYDCADLTITDNLLSQWSRAGVTADMTTGMITQNGLVSNFYGIVIQNNSDIELSGNSFDGNNQDILESDERELDIPPPI